MAKLIVYLLCLSGPALAAAYTTRKMIGILLLTQLGFTMLVYVGALLGALRPAAILALAIGAGMWIAAIVRVSAKRDFAALKRFVSPSVAIFTLLTGLFALSSRGMQVHQWDEFSHWAYAVQEMGLNGRLYTAAVSDDLFKAYPPLMPLWQYVCQMPQLLFGKNVRGDLLYYSQQILGIGLFMPFTDRLTWKRPWAVLLAALGIIALPTVVYSDYYSLVYIDAFLGLIAGCVFSMIALNLWKKPVGAALLALAEAALVLTKDSGLSFAAISLGYLFLCVMAEKKGERHYKAFLLAMAAVILAKLTWSTHLHAMDIAGSGIRVNVADLFALLTGKAPDSYRHQVIANFGRFLFEESLRITPLRLPVSYFLAIMLLLVLIPIVQGGKAATRLWVACFANAAIYIAGLLLLYLYHFGEYNALRIASGARYLKSLVLCLVMILFCVSLKRLSRKRFVYSGVIAVCVMILAGSWGDIVAYAAGRTADESAQAAKPFRTVSESIAAKIDPQEDRAKVYLLLQEKNDHPYYGIRYYVRPHAQVNWLYWHAGEQDYSAAYNIWKMDADDFAERLREYDYLYVGAADEYVQAAFAMLFEEGKIEAYQVYRVLQTDDGIRLSKIAS